MGASEEDTSMKTRHEPRTKRQGPEPKPVNSEDVTKGLSLHPREWSPREVQLWCKSIHVPVLAQKVKEYAVDGPTLLSFTEEDLQGIGISTPFIQRRVMSAVKGLGGG